MSHGNTEIITVLASTIVQPFTGWLSLWLYARIRRSPTLAPAWDRSTLWAALSGLFLPTPLCLAFYVWVDLRSLHPRWLAPLVRTSSRRAALFVIDLLLTFAGFALSILLAWAPLALVFELFGIE